MPAQYTLWIVSPPDLIWSHVFDEVALSLSSAFAELGYDVPIVTDPHDIRGTAIILGANLAPMYKIRLPRDSIIFNLEQVHSESRWFDPKYGYIELLKRLPVWDFNHQNMEALKQLGVGNVVYCGIGYAPELTRIPKAKQDVDVLFIGGGHPRRSKILDEVTSKGARLHQVYKVFGEERDQWMARGKVHLNIHKEPAQLFEIVRISYLLANRCFVVSETGRDPQVEAQFKDALIFSPYETLADTCLKYLVQPKQRKQIADAGFEIFSKMRQSSYLAEALEQHFWLHGEGAARKLPEKPVATGTQKPRIFVSIASFRDPEIQPTLRDMFAAAAHPERISVGICLQVDAEVDKDCFVNPQFRPGQVRVHQVDYKDSLGANWARDQAMKLRQQEEYVLMIDSHMRFERGWDETLIAMLERCPAEKPVVSAYAADYNPPNLRARHIDEILRIRIRRLGAAHDAQLVHVTGALVPRTGDRGGLYPSPFCVANFFFARASTFDEIPIDPHIHFWGDEINYAARLWTHGYDIFQPDRTVLYHYWVRKDKFHLHDYRMPRTAKNKRSMMRVKHVLGFEKCNDPALLVDVERYALGKQRPLQGLWEFAGIDWKKRKITPNAEEGIWNMTARDKALKKVPTAKESAAAVPALPRIFVQIASYRDPECQWTVKDLFEKAAHPERIFVGICWQFVKDEDGICFQEPYPRPEQVRVHEVDARVGKGVCWARSLTQKLWQGEEFTLQIDSHMRFEPGWDDMLMSMWHECHHEKAILTCYPPGYTPPEQFDRQWIFGMSAKEFDSQGVFLMQGSPSFEVGKTEPEKPMKGAFASANMLFGPSSLLADVPYDPHLYFFGEEITLAVRLWTSGYELFHPNRLVIFHDWNRDRRKTHFSDHRDWGRLNDLSIARVLHLLNMKSSSDPEVLDDIDRFGLGKIRTLDAYQSYSGVNFANRTIAEKAFKGDFVTEKPAATPTVPAATGIARRKTGGAKNGKIFINIASYRDPECQWTVKNLYEKAANPDRVFVGICWQFDPEEDKHCFEVVTRPDQVRMMPVNWRDAEGVCWARYQTQQLWDDEEYTLMIDSHMRFVPGWDDLMIKELAACESAKPLLSCSPTPYFPPDRLGQKMNPTIRRVKPFMPDGNIRCQGEMLDRVPEKPLRGAFLVANFIFSRSEITPEVPYDPYLYFDQEEISYAARLYTHGWDVFSSRQQFLYHYYNDGKVPGGSVRPLHWRDLHKEDDKRIRYLRERGLKRFNHLTRYQLSNDPDVIKELDIYGFGRERTLQQYEEFSGVDFKRKIATERALRCQFIPDLKKYRDRPIHVPEVDDKKKTDAPPPAPAAKPATAVNPPTAATVVPFTPPTSAAAQPQGQKSVQPVLKMLERGDYLPMFELLDSNGKPRAVESFGGRYFLLAYLPATHVQYVERFLREMHIQSEKAGLKNIWQMYILDGTVEQIAEIKQKYHVPHILLADPERKIARAFGLYKPGEAIAPTGFVLNKNIKITHRFWNLEPDSLAAALLKEGASEMELYKQRNREPRVITELPAALIVPDVFTPEFCAKCINAFRTGHTFEGTVGAGESKAYRPDTKIRTDYVVSGELLEEMDEKMSRSFFPEIKKIFGFDVTYREIYKIGLYTGEKGGFFKAHRDNYDSPLGYRRIASTIHLNDEYEGGGLRFPEYDDNIYRPAAGSGIAFSCATQHEARPVTKGERFIVVAFLHGDEDEGYRRNYQAVNNQPLKIRDYNPAIRRYNEIKQSRHFFEEWRNRQLLINGEPTKNGILQPGQPVAAAAVAAPPASASVAAKPNIMVNTIGNHQAKKVFESKAGIVFDNFLPDDLFQQIRDFVVGSEFEYINTKGKVNRAWHIHDGFPLRSCENFFYYAEGKDKPAFDYIYPTKKVIDGFVEHILAIQPQIEHLVGKQSADWAHFSLTSWIYPHGTGLAMHDDGSGVYTGAYAYFLNPTWRAHWGGLNILMDDDANRLVHEYRGTVDQMDFYKRKYLHANPTDDLLLESGIGQCIFPKGNRIVFIANNAYHMVTRVNEQSGDNVRMSIAGFFDRKK